MLLQCHETIANLIVIENYKNEVRKYSHIYIIYALNTTLESLKL